MQLSTVVVDCVGKISTVELRGVGVNLRWGDRCTELGVEVEKHW